MTHAIVTDDQVRRLLSDQFPRWADRPFRRMATAGTDHALFRLGDDLALRLPLHEDAARQAEKEQRWLPVLALRLPLAVPVPVARGEPGADYPFVWSVVPWLPGESADLCGPTNPIDAAESLGRFVRTLREIDAAEAPSPGRHNFHRGVPLRERDPGVREALARLPASVAIDANAAGAAWEAALNTPAWDGPPVWIHGDLHPANLLVDGGVLRAVIDFGGLGAGDPACDAMAGWTVFDADARDRYREAGYFDAAAWARGRGWALSMGLIALPYYAENHPFYRLAFRMTEAVLTDS